MRTTAGSSARARSGAGPPEALARPIRSTPGAGRRTTAAMAPSPARPPPAPAATGTLPVMAAAGPGRSPFRRPDSGPAVSWSWTSRAATRRRLPPSGPAVDPIGQGLVELRDGAREAGARTVAAAPDAAAASDRGPPQERHGPIASAGRGCSRPELAPGPRCAPRRDHGRPTVRSPTAVQPQSNPCRGPPRRRHAGQPRRPRRSRQARRRRHPHAARCRHRPATPPGDHARPSWCGRRRPAAGRYGRRSTPGAWPAAGCRRARRRRARTRRRGPGRPAAAAPAAG